MPSAFAWILAVRYLFARWINILCVGGIAVAVWAMIVVIAIFSGFIGDIRDRIHTATPDLLITDLPADQSQEPILDALDGLDCVVASAPRATHHGVLYPRGRKRNGRIIERAPQLASLDPQADQTAFVKILGVDPEAEYRTTKMRTWVDAASDPFRVENVDTPFDIRKERRQRGIAAVDATLDSDLHFEAMLIGQRRYSLSVRGAPFVPARLVDFVSARFTTDGELREIKQTFHEAGAYDTRYRLFAENVVIVPIDSVRSMLGHSIENPDAVPLVTSVAVRVADGTALLDARDRIQAAMTEVGVDCRVLTWEEQNDVFLGAVDQERAMMRIVLFVVMLIAAFLIYATLQMMVVQKTKDIGILNALGGNRRSIQSVFLLTGAVVAGVGCSIGTGIALFSLIYLNATNEWLLENVGIELFPSDLYDLPEIPWRLETMDVVQVVAVAFGLSLLLSWLPARRAARLDPVQALAYE